jgi:hypothetical protein
MEKAYLDTIPIEWWDEELHAYMQELGQQFYATLSEDFRTWADRTLDDVCTRRPSGARKVARREKA